MNGQPDRDPIRDFLDRSFTAAGGVVDDLPGSLEILVPAEVARQLGIPESAVVGLSSFDHSTATSDPRVIDGRIGSALLERLVAERLERPPFSAIALPAGLPTPTPDHWPVLLNAVRVDTPERHRVIARYLSADLRLTLQGEELRSVLVKVTIRLQDGARTQPFVVSGAYRITPALLDSQERASVQVVLRSWLASEAPALHAPALETLRRRARRDLDNMAQYYAGLDSELGKAAGRARSSDERTRRQAKWAGLRTDLDSRREQLRVRIRPRLAARLVAATLIQSEVEPFNFTVRRRSREGTVTVIYRTPDGVFEGPACSSCRLATLRMYLCDDQLHVLCEACGRAGRLDAARCPACCSAPPKRPVVAIDDPTQQLRLGPQP